MTRVMTERMGGIKKTRKFQVLSQVDTTAFGDLLMWEDEEKGRVKANLPDFDPVLHPIFQIHHITYYLID